MQRTIQINVCVQGATAGIVAEVNMKVSLLASARDFSGIESMAIVKKINSMKISNFVLKRE